MTSRKVTSDLSDKTTIGHCRRNSKSPKQQKETVMKDGSTNLGEPADYRNLRDESV
jgi:hypothetical protein